MMQSYTYPATGPYGPKGARNKKKMQSYTYLAPANAIATVEDRLSLGTDCLYWERQKQFQDDKAPKRTSEREVLLLLQQRRQQQAGRGPRKKRKEIQIKEPTNWRVHH